MVNNEEGNWGRLDNKECEVLAVFSPWTASLAHSLRQTLLSLGCSSPAAQGAWPQERLKSPF